MQPYASNDTYICPDCGSEVRVGARDCPGCGPFQPMMDEAEEWQEANEDLQMNCVLPVPQKTLEVLEEKPVKPRFITWFLVILIVMTLLAGVSAGLKLFAH